MASNNMDTNFIRIEEDNTSNQNVSNTSNNNNSKIKNNRKASVFFQEVDNQGFNSDETINNVTNDNGIGQKIALKLVIPKNNYIEEDPNGYENGQSIHYRKQKRAISLTDGRSPATPNRPNRVSYQPSIGGLSLISQSELDQNIPPPSSTHEKSKHTRKFLATVCGVSYTIFLVTFGSVVFIGSAISDHYPLAEAFSISIIVIGFAYFLFLYIDIRLYTNKANKALKERENRQQTYEEEMSKYTMQFENGPIELKDAINGKIQLEIPMPELDFSDIKPLSHKYCFTTGRHGEFFYLKLGAAWFCFGLVINYSLIISYQIIFLTSTEPNFYRCASVITLVFDILFPLYSLFILFFIFKYANVIINQNRAVARLALMHAIGTSLAFWVFTIVRETTDSIRLKENKENITNFKSHVQEKNTDFLAEVCPGPGALNVIYKNFSPYLYPFIIEFCILIVGIFYMIYSNINQCPKKKSTSGHNTPNNLNSQEEFAGNLQNSGTSSEISEHYRITAEHDIQYKSNLVIHADCHAANRGLFGGLILIAFTIVFIILFFVAISDDEHFQIGITMDSIFELIVLIIMIIGVIITYFQTSKLDVNSHPISMLDDVLLFIAIPAFFLETIFSMLPAVENVSVINICTIIAQLMQIMIQTPFIIDGLRRCSNASILRKKKPGREMITFLTIANVSLWIYYTFSVKNVYIGDERYIYYGDVLWTILNHLSLPLIMFYRFHSSVCLVDIWRHAYEPGGGN